MKPEMSSEPVDTPSHRSVNLSKGYSAIFATVFIWSLPSLFMFYLNRYYDPWAQNFYRYSVACIAIAPLVLYRINRGGPRIDLRAVKLCLLPCLPNVVHQVTQVMALFYVGPGVYTIFTRASVIFTALLALAFFPEERVVIRQWQFQLGTLLGLIGAFGVIWFQANAGSHEQHVALPGLFIAFTATICWALYGVLIKRPSAELGPIRSFGLVSFHYLGTAVSSHPGVRQNRHSVSRWSAGEPGSYHFGGNVYHARPCSLLRGNKRNRSCTLSKSPASLSRYCNGALRQVLRRATDARADLECCDSVNRGVSCHAHKTCRHRGNR